MKTDRSNAPNDKSSEQLEQLYERFRSTIDVQKRRQLGFDIIALTPPERTPDLLGFLEDQDLWVQEEAAEALGRRRYQPAIPQLVKVAQRETTRVHNARIGAILALGRMKSAEGLEALLGLAGTIPTSFHPYLVKAMELHGCPIKYEGGQWKFQLPGTNQWSTF
jgi:HEAT repeat protein